MITNLDNYPITRKLLSYKSPLRNMILDQLNGSSVNEVFMPKDIKPGETVTLRPEVIEDFLDFMHNYLLKYESGEDVPVTLPGMKNEDVSMPVRFANALNSLFIGKPAFTSSGYDYTPSEASLSGEGAQLFNTFMREKATLDGVEDAVSKVLLKKYDTTDINEALQSDAEQAKLAEAAARAIKAGSLRPSSVLTEVLTEDKLAKRKENQAKENLKSLFSTFGAPTIDKPVIDMKTDGLTKPVINKNTRPIATDSKLADDGSVTDKYGRTIEGIPVYYSAYRNPSQMATFGVKDRYGSNVALEPLLDRSFDKAYIDPEDFRDITRSLENSGFTVIDDPDSSRYRIVGPLSKEPLYRQLVEEELKEKTGLPIQYFGNIVDTSGRTLGINKDKMAQIIKREIDDRLKQKTKDINLKYKDLDDAIDRVSDIDYNAKHGPDMQFGPRVLEGLSDAFTLDKIYDKIRSGNGSVINDQILNSLVEYPSEGTINKLHDAVKLLNNTHGKTLKDFDLLEDGKPGPNFLVNLIRNSDELKQWIEMSRRAKLADANEGLGELLKQSLTDANISDRMRKWRDPMSEKFEEALKDLDFTDSTFDSWFKDHASAGDGLKFKGASKPKSKALDYIDESENENKEKDYLEKFPWLANDRLVGTGTTFSRKLNTRPAASKYGLGSYFDSVVGTGTGQVRVLTADAIKKLTDDRVAEKEKMMSEINAEQDAQDEKLFGIEAPYIKQMGRSKSDDRRYVLGTKALDSVKNAILAAIARQSATDLAKLEKYNPTLFNKAHELAMEVVNEDLERKQKNAKKADKSLDTRLKNAALKNKDNRETAEEIKKGEKIDAARARSLAKSKFKRGVKNFEDTYGHKPTLNDMDLLVQMAGLPSLNDFEPEAVKVLEEELGSFDLNSSYTGTPLQGIIDKWTMKVSNGKDPDISEITDDLDGFTEDEKRIAFTAIQESLDKAKESKAGISIESEKDYNDTRESETKVEKLNDKHSFSKHRKAKKMKQNEKLKEGLANLDAADGNEDGNIDVSAIAKAIDNSTIETKGDED